MSDDRGHLHDAAFRALSGLSDTPERDLAALLRSDHEIDPIIRRRLADALEGKALAGNISLKAQGNGGNAAVKSMRTQVRSVRLGREVKRRQADGMAYKTAVELLADEQCVSEKKVEAAVTLAGEVDAWINRQLPTRKSPLGEDVERFILEQTYCFAIAKKRDPDEFLVEIDRNAMKTGEDWRFGGSP